MKDGGLQFGVEYAILEYVGAVRKKNGTKTKHMYHKPRRKAGFVFG